jgi:hypothetical protein
LAIAVLLLSKAQLLFFQIHKDTVGSVVGIPPLPKNLNQQEVGTVIPAFTGIFLNDHSVIYNPSETAIPKAKGTRCNF